MDGGSAETPEAYKHTVALDLLQDLSRLLDGTYRDGMVPPKAYASIALRAIASNVDILRRLAEAPRGKKA